MDFARDKKPDPRGAYGKEYCFILIGIVNCSRMLWVFSSMWFQFDVVDFLLPLSFSLSYTHPTITTSNWPLNVSKFDYNDLIEFFVLLALSLRQSEWTISVSASRDLFISQITFSLRKRLAKRSFHCPKYDEGMEVREPNEGMEVLITIVMLP